MYTVSNWTIYISTFFCFN